MNHTSANWQLLHSWYLKYLSWVNSFSSSGHRHIPRVSVTVRISMRCIILNYTTSHHIILYYYNIYMLCCIVLHCIALYCIVLYCVVLCCIVLCCIVLYVIYENLTGFSSTMNSFQSEAKLRIGTNSEYLKTRSCPNWRLFNDFSESITGLAQWISVLVMSVSTNKPIVWNNSSSPLPSTSIVFQVCSRGAIQHVWLNDILVYYWRV